MRSHAHNISLSDVFVVYPYELSNSTTIKLTVVIAVAKLAVSDLVKEKVYYAGKTYT